MAKTNSELRQQIVQLRVQLERRNIELTNLKKSIAEQQATNKKLAVKVEV